MSWNTFKISDVAAVKGGKRLPQGETLTTKNTGLPYIRVTDMVKYSVNTKNLLYLQPDVQSAINRYIITSDDVYITIAGTIGMVGIIPEALNGANLTENAARICITNDEIEKEYLMYFLSCQSAQEQIASSTSKNAQPKLAIARINSLDIKAPAKVEQRKIVHILSTLQKAIQKQEELINTTTALKKSLLNKLFTEGTKGETLKQTPLGMIPESWKVVSLADVCVRISIGYQPDKSGSKKYVGLEHIESGAIKIKVCGKESDVRSSKSVFKNGQILYGKLRPYLDKCVVADFDGVCSTDILVFNGLGDVTNDFLVQLLHSEQFLAFAKSSTTGVQHPRTSWNVLKDFRFALPTDENERNLIAHSLQSLNLKADNHNSKRDIYQNLFNTLLNDLMTGSIRVQDIDFNSTLPSIEKKETSSKTVTA